MNIPFHRPLIEDDDIRAVVETLESGWITTGPAVKAFEKEFAEYVGARHAVAVNSCTAAMHLALAGLGIGPGDEVITTPYTFVATAEAIQYTGATPVFVDIQETDLNIDPQRVYETIRHSEVQSRSKVRAILPVHIAGHPCNLPALLQIAKEQELVVVEDAAHCLEGALRPSANGQPNAADLKIGALSDATCFSFYATKNITTGEGGMVTSNRDDLAEEMRILSLHGMSRDAWKRYTAEGSWYYEIPKQGFKYNMPDILAALGRNQLKKVPRMLQRRQRYARLLMERLQGLDEVILPAESPLVQHAWHLFIIRLRLDRLKLTRSEFIEKLKQKGVQTSVHFIPLHLQPFYQQHFKYQKGDFPVAERVYEAAVSLPLYPAMTEEEVAYVASAVTETVAQAALRDKIVVPMAIA